MIVGCLALNASYEPLTMVPMKRALRLVIDGKAVIVEADADRLVRSERLALPRPMVIRLNRFVHVPIPLAIDGRRCLDPGGEEWQRVLESTGQRSLQRAPATAPASGRPTSPDAAIP